MRRTVKLVGRGYGVVLVDSTCYLFYSGRATGRLPHPRSRKTSMDVRRLVERGACFVEGL